MKSFAIGSVLLAAGANALVARDGTCCFGITASGPAANGTVDQLGDGQTRVGGSDLQAGTFCIDTNGAITDGEGRGCVITTETTQFQCDLNNNSPTSGFSVLSNGDLAHNGSTTFYVCETGGNGENIYLQTGPDVTMCTPTTLTADNCKNVANSCAMSSSSLASSAAPATVASSAAPVASSAAPVASSAASIASSVAPVASSVETSATSVGASVLPTYTESSVASSAVPASSAPVESSTWVATSSAPAETATAPSTASTTVEVTSTHKVVPVTKSSEVASSSVWSSTSVESSVAPSSTVESSTAPVIASTSVAASTKPATTLIPHWSNGTATTATSTAASTSSASSSCPTTLTSGSYQYPHLIIPVSSDHPDTAYGTQYNGYANSTTSTIVNFDIPADYSGKTCSLIFDFPTKAELETSDYTISGNGALDFSKLSSVATQSTTYDSVPSVATNYGTTTIVAGNGYVIATFDCPASTTVSYEISNAGSTNLEWFNDWNPSPLGVFITTC